MNLTGGSHQVAVYLLDYSVNTRNETITLKDTITGGTLDTETASSFSGGVYYLWNVSGDVTATFTTNAGSNSVVSGLFFGLGSGSTAPTVPTSLTATGGSGQVSLSWTASTGVTSYNIYRGTTSGGEGTAPIATEVTTTSYTDTAVSGATTYYYNAIAINAVGGSGSSNEASATTTPAAPRWEAPWTATGYVTLHWFLSTGATSYNIYRSTTSGGEGSTPLVTGVSGTTYTVSGLTNGTTYYYKLAAVNAVGVSSQSNSMNTNLLPPRP